MRTVLVTGPGGAGRTTVAAATALAAARRGSRTLLLSADSTGQPLPVEAGPRPDEPAEVAEGLWAARIDSAGHFRTELLTLQERVASGLDLLGARKLAGEELTELPGSEQFALLHALSAAARADWDVLVVDMPPLRDALAVLALPEQLRRYMRRLLPPERQAARALRPMMAQLAGVPMPTQWLYRTVEHRDTELAVVQSLIEDGTTTVRLVAEPGPAAAESLHSARVGLALYGIRVEALVANRLIPGDQADPWAASLVAQQQKCLDGWHESWAPEVPVLEAAHLGRDPHGIGDLTALDVPEPDERPEGLADDPWWIEDRLADDNLLVWNLPLPGVRKKDVNLVRKDDELLLTVGPFRRIVPLTSALRRCTVSGAALTDDVLRVRFTPDPAVWPHAD